MVIEEKGDDVIISVMKEGTYPVQRKYPGSSLEIMLTQPSIDAGDLDTPVLAFLAGAMALWMPAAETKPTETKTEEVK